MERDRGARAVVQVWPQRVAEDARRIITIGHGSYTPEEALAFADEIIKAARRGEALLTEPSPVPDGWEKCEGMFNCPDAGQWGASVDPNDHTRWRRWHAWHQVNVNHGFVIHQVCA